MGHHKLRYEPHGVLLVLDDGTAHGTRCTIQLINNLHLVRLGIVHGNTRWRGYPQDASAVKHGIVDGRTDEVLSTLRGIEIGNLMSSEVENRHVL